MVRKCFVCRKTSTSKGDLSFHRFPTDPDTKKIWQSLLNIKGLLPKSAVICSEHFEPSDFHHSQDYRNKYIKRGRLPKFLGSLYKDSSDGLSTTLNIYFDEQELPSPTGNEQNPCSIAGSLTSLSPSLDMDFKEEELRSPTGFEQASCLMAGFSVTSSSPSLEMDFKEEELRSPTGIEQDSCLIADSSVTRITQGSPISSSRTETASEAEINVETIVLSYSDLKSQDHTQNKSLLAPSLNMQVYKPQLPSQMAGIEQASCSIAGSSVTRTESASEDEIEVIRSSDSNLKSHDSKWKRRNRYIGDLSPEDFSTPEKRKKIITKIQQRDAKLRKEKHVLQMTVRRLRLQITKLKSKLKKAEG